ncbi:MAG: hypothetical protein ICV83_19605 [Cytophagales bacterium]|nr:hypothetical protein [Cytophagales bacterium]
MLAMLAMAFTLVFSSCKKDDEPTPITKEKLTAVWKLESSKTIITAAGQTAPPVTEPGSGETLELKSDGTSISKDEDGVTSTGTWSLTGTKLTMTSQSGEYEGTFEVKEASNVLVLHTVEEMAAFGMKIEATLTFKK